MNYLMGFHQTITYIISELKDPLRTLLLTSPSSGPLPGPPIEVEKKMFPKNRLSADQAEGYYCWLKLVIRFIHARQYPESRPRHLHDMRACRALLF